ncbi:hypothetical protein HZA97_05775 [Candidatus Woesearchaeota archaeon]|nr:hypothetical protein [Candidatus Woesearchaeota archaeon]
MPQLFGRPLWSFLPGGSWFYLNNQNQGPNSFSGSFLLECFHGLYFVAGCVYVAMIIETGSFDPHEQRRIQETRKIEAKQREERYAYLHQRVFGPAGFADLNFDKNVDVKETANFYVKMGIKNISDQPTLEQLEKIVKECSGDN